MALWVRDGVGLGLCGRGVSDILFLRAINFSRWRPENSWQEINVNPI